jgi:hypothetical protein
MVRDYFTDQKALLKRANTRVPANEIVGDWLNQGRKLLRKTVLVAFHKNAPIGFIVGSHISDNLFNFTRVFFKPEFRGKNWLIGSALSYALAKTASSYARFSTKIFKENAASIEGNGRVGSGWTALGNAESSTDFVSTPKQLLENQGGIPRHN